MAHVPSLLYVLYRNLKAFGRNCTGSGLRGLARVQESKKELS